MALLPAAGEGALSLLEERGKPTDQRTLLWVEPAVLSKQQRDLVSHCPLSIGQSDPDGQERLAERNPRSRPGEVAKDFGNHYLVKPNLLVRYCMASILFVDDDRITLDAYRQVLSNAGHELLAATDGVHALAILDTRAVDALITDMVMPYIDGDRLARIVAHRYKPRPFTIALSAAAVEQEARLTNPCIDAYVAKGSINSTSQIILNALEGKRPHKGLLRPENLRKRRMTVELLDRREELNLILERMNQGVIRFDGSGIVLYANRGALDFLELDEAEAIGRSVRTLFMDTAVTELLDSNEATHGVSTLQGGQLFVRLELTDPREDPEGGRLLFMQDVTAEHTFSASLERSEQGYRAIVESTGDILWTVDLAGNLTYVNPANRHYTGYSMGDYYAAGLPLLFGMDREEVQSYLKEATDGCRRGESISLERRIPSKEGAPIWSLIRISPLKDETGTITGLRCAATNIDRRRMAEIKLRDAVEERETLIREIHHRVKNSVQLIISMLRLRLSRIDSEEVKRAAEDMESRIRVISQVYAQLYDHRRLNRLDGKRLIEAVVQNVRTEGVPFYLDMEGDTFLLSLDQAIPLGLITRELATNVADHVVPVNGEARLRIRWEVSGEEVAIRYEDNGPGPPEEELTTPSSLGFLISTSLADQLKGKLDLDRQSPASTVRLTFPYAPPRQVEEIETV